MTTGWEAARREASAAGPAVSDSIHKALLQHLRSKDDPGYDSGRLHYGSDLYPGACERKIWYRLHGEKRDEESLGSQLRFEGGRHVEDMILDALEASGKTILRQVKVRPLRPSAWAWIGRADAVVVEDRKLLEIKGPRAALFARAKGDPTKLAKEQYLWQASSYFHELKRSRFWTRPAVDTASFVFVDREGSNEPIELEIVGDLLISEDAIIAQELERAKLVNAPEAPDRIKGVVVVDVLKGGRATKKTPIPERVIRAVNKLNWQCSYCPYRSTCKPETMEAPVEFSPAKILAEAERRWAAGAKKVQIVLGDDDDSDEYTDGEAVEVEEDPSLIEVAFTTTWTESTPVKATLQLIPIEAMTPPATVATVTVDASVVTPPVAAVEVIAPSTVAAPEVTPSNAGRGFTLEDGLSRIGPGQVRHIQDLLALTDDSSAGNLSSAILNLAVRHHELAPVMDLWNKVGGQLTPNGRKKTLLVGQLKTLLLGLPIKFPGGVTASSETPFNVDLPSSRSDRGAGDDPPTMTAPAPRSPLMFADPDKLEPVPEDQRGS